MKRVVLTGDILPFAVHQPISCPNCAWVFNVPNPQGIEGVDVADESSPGGRLLSSELKRIGHHRVRVIVELF